MNLERWASLIPTPHAPQQPVRQADKFRPNPPLPLTSRLNVFDRMAENPPLDVKFENEKPRKCFVRLLIASLEEVPEWQRPSYALATRGPPAHDELLCA